MRFPKFAFLLLALDDTFLKLKFADYLLIYARTEAEMRRRQCRPECLRRLEVTELHDIFIATSAMLGIVIVACTGNAMGSLGLCADGQFPVELHAVPPAVRSVGPGLKYMR